MVPKKCSPNGKREKNAIRVTTNQERRLRMPEKMSSEDVTQVRLKEVIDFIEAGVSSSGKPFSFLSIRLKRLLTLEEQTLFCNFLNRKYSKVGILSLLPAQIWAFEIQLTPKLPPTTLGEPLPNQTSGTLGTVLRLSQALERDFGVAPATMNDWLQPFDERTT